MSRNYTEVADKIPKNWKIVRLREIADVKGGKRLPKGEKFSEEKTSYPYIRVVDFRNMGVDTSNLKYLKPQTYKKIRNYTISSKDVYISIAGTIGLAGIIPKELNGANLTENAAKLCNLRDVNNLFLAYVLNSAICTRQINAYIGKATQPKLALFRIEKIKIPLPPLPEQKAIAKILSTVDEAIQKVDGIIAKTERLKKGLMQKLLIKGIGHKEFKYSEELGCEIPKEWKIVKIRNIGKVFTGKTPSTSIEKFWNGDIPFITPGDITEHKYVYKTQRYVTVEGAKQVGIIPKNAVLVVCIGSTIGKTAISWTESTTNQQINSIICNKKIADAHYIFYIISRRSKLLKSFSGVAAVPIIKKSLFEELKIPFPPLSEQQEIAEILSTVDKKLELERKRKEKLERIKKGLMNDLLIGRKRVNVQKVLGSG